MKTIPLINYFAETLKEYLEGWQGTQKELAQLTGIIPSHISEMKSGKRKCTPEYDLRLSRFFSITPGYFFRLQNRHDLEIVKRKKLAQIEKTVQPMRS